MPREAVLNPHSLKEAALCGLQVRSSPEGMWGVWEGTLYPACRKKRRPAHPHPQEEPSSYHMGKKTSAKPRGWQYRYQTEKNGSGPREQNRTRIARTEPVCSLGLGEDACAGRHGGSILRPCPPPPLSRYGVRAIWSWWEDFLGRWLSAQIMPVLPAHPKGHCSPETLMTGKAVLAAQGPREGAIWNF